MFIFTVLGFAAQLIVIASIISIAISCASFPQPSIVVTSEDHPSGAVVPVDDGGSDASLSGTARVTCAKSMASPVYVTTIDESVVSPFDYSALTIRELKALCRERGVKRYSSLRKHELVELLSTL